VRVIWKGADEWSTRPFPLHIRDPHDLRPALGVDLDAADELAQDAGPRTRGYGGYGGYAEMGLQEEKRRAMRKGLMGLACAPGAGSVVAPGQS
jgi:hypothetical protein